MMHQVIDRTTHDLRARRLMTMPVLLLLPLAAQSHDSVANETLNLWLAWDFHPRVSLPILFGTLLYAAGLFRAWRRVGIGHVIPRRCALAYALGMLLLVVALMSPLDAFAAQLFSVHMVQHLILLTAAPLLLVLGLPERALPWAVPRRLRRRTAVLTLRLFGTLSGAGGTKVPLLVLCAASGVMWLWHLPALYDLALADAAVHWSEHASFLITALLFWAGLLRLRPRDHAGNGPRLLYLFAMALQGSVLGALLTIASRPLYAHALTAPRWGFDPLADQQLAGVIMWVPPGLLYLAVALWLAAAWLRAVGSPREFEPEGAARGEEG